MHYILTKALRPDRLIANTIRVNFNLSWQALAVQSWPDEHFLQLVRSSSLELNKRALLDDVSHLLLLLLSLVSFLLQLCDLLHEVVKTVPVWRPIGNGTDEGGIGILKGLRR